MKNFLVAILISLIAIGAFGQVAKPAQRISAEEVKQTIVESSLQLKTGPNGSMSSEWGNYPSHAIKLSVRSKSGGAEVHEHYADIFIVTSGEATLVSGGIVVDGHSAGLGETRGTTIHGGTRQVMKLGDVIHVPAGTPHQTLIDPGKTFSCLVIKVKED